MRECGSPSIPNGTSENVGNVTKDNFLETKYKGFLRFWDKNSVVGSVLHWYLEIAVAVDIHNFWWKIDMFGSPETLFRQNTQKRAILAPSKRYI